ncbi:hypothetical protein Z517_09299 [Fonsecaea pedrosoi CBS 271.37]|uniref:Unplaced genomic scaffold supercont1.6, whole genome shotgun sequence n=1 Tax=Fonsecaea pedrosoi CBS 271.37 TaxID=1442368 RepID=A0A0D2GDW4_9EURO|nr:uncharacterized protein Z517_09299 [Fonsecaea pedrosoi CBS 271.37]KIW76855.1 hypothetical protein Z517_09299 [Fonsecaea pedrosoi CBS 271.37]
MERRLPSDGEFLHFPEPSSSRGTVAQAGFGGGYNPMREPVVTPDGIAAPTSSGSMPRAPVDANSAHTSRDDMSPGLKFAWDDVYVVEDGHFVDPRELVRSTTLSLLLNKRYLPDTPEFLPFIPRGTMSYMCPSGVEAEFKLLGGLPLGFSLEDGQWVTHRTQYFAATGTVTIRPWYPANHLVFTSDDGCTSGYVVGFGLGISAKHAKEYEFSVAPKLLQFTAKRVKNETCEPDIIDLNPCEVSATPEGEEFPNILVNRADARWASKEGVTQHTYERLQFTKATINRQTQKFFQVEMILYAKLVDQAGYPVEFGTTSNGWSIIGSMESTEVMVRGRNRGYFKEVAEKKTERKKERLAMEQDMEGSSESDRTMVIDE